MRITIDSFSGRKPKLAPHLIDNSQAQYALNARVEKGDLRGWNAALDVEEPDVSSPKTLYRYDETTNEHWISSATDFDFVKTPIAGGAFERVYFTGGDELHALANDIVSSPFDFTTDYYKVGPTKPTTGPGLTGYTTGSDYRAYYYTYVSRYGEEGPPSGLGTIIDYGSGNVTVSTLAQPPADYACRTAIGGNKPKIRLYRTNSSSSGAEFQFVKEVDIDAVPNWSTFTITDGVSDSDLGEVCPSENYSVCPDDVSGLVGLPNGIFACFKGNQVFLSEPFLPNAWPSSYDLSFDQTVVGLGVHGSSLVVLTDGVPYMVYGESPESMSKQKLPGFYPCLSKRGIVNTPIGVMFPSTEGMIIIDHNGPRCLTFDFITPTGWEEYAPSTMHSGFYNGKLFGFFPTTSLVTRGLIFDIYNETWTDIYRYCDATHITSDGKFYVVEENAEYTKMIRSWKGDPYNYTYYTWKSKRYMLPHDTNFTCGQVLLDLDYYNEVIDLLEENAVLATKNTALFAADLLGSINSYEINGDEINGDTLYDIRNVFISSSIQIKVYIDGELKLNRAVDNPKFFRLPSGFRGRRWEIQLEGYIPIRKVILATSPQELR